MWIYVGFGSDSWCCSANLLGDFILWHFLLAGSMRLLVVVHPPLRSSGQLRGELQNVCALQCKSLQWHLNHSAAMMQCCQCLLDQGQNPLCCLSFGGMDRFLKLKNRMAVSADANMSTWLAGYANVANWLPECKHCATETTQLVKKFLTSPSVACVHWQVTSSVLDTLQLGVGIILCLYFVSCNLVNLLTSWLISHASVWLN